jgi:SagB-type dehydrogenase family enzyme
MWGGPPVDDPRVLMHFESLDIARFPWFFKRYAQSLPTAPLPRDLPSTTARAVAVLAGTADVSPAELDLPQLSRLLHLSAGVVRKAAWAHGTWIYRAAGSAGGRFPLELYVVVPHGAGVPAGVHWYHPQEHALVHVGAPPRGEAPALVVTGIPWRTGWKYRERGYRHVYWDAGTMLSQVLVVADSAGITAQLHTRFPDVPVASLVGADGVHEWPVAVVTLGDGTPALDATGPAVAGDVDAAPMEFPLVTAAQRAGDGDRLGPRWDRGAPVDVPLDESDPMEDVVLARSSQRRMDRARSLPESLVRTSMAVALRGVDVPHHVVVHNVDGIEPGLYGWPDLSNPVRSGAMRDTMYRLSFEQDLACDAAFVVIAATAVDALDDREYREAQLAAGLVEGRLHLASYSLGASASGMGFLDSEVPEFLDEPLDALLFTCVGVPEYKSARGGLPGAPSVIRTVRSRASSSTFTPPLPQRTN